MLVLFATAKLVKASSVPIESAAKRDGAGIKLNKEKDLVTFEADEH